MCLYGHVSGFIRNSSEHLMYVKLLVFITLINFDILKCNWCLQTLISQDFPCPNIPLIYLRPMFLINSSFCQPYYSSYGLWPRTAGIIKGFDHWPEISTLQFIFHECLTFVSRKNICFFKSNANNNKYVFFKSNGNNNNKSKPEAI